MNNFDETQTNEVLLPLSMVDSDLTIECPRIKYQMPFYIRIKSLLRRCLRKPPIVLTEEERIKFYAKNL